MKKHKKLSCALSLALVVGLLSSCNYSKNTHVSTSTPKKNSSNITLTLGHHESAFPKSGIMEELAKDFEGETGVHIIFKEYPDAQWRDLLKAELIDETAPDIFAVDSDAFSLYDRIRPDINCIDLTKEEFVGRMDQDVLPSISYKKKVYGITFPGKKMWVYAYNKQIFRDLNLTIPTTYKEFKKVCQTIKDAGITPVWESPSSGWHQVLPLFELGPYYEKNDPYLYKKLNTNKTSIKDIKALKTVINQINEFEELGFYGDNYLGNNYTDEAKEFAAGKYGMTLEGIGWPSQVINDYPEMKDNIGIFVMPWADNQILGINPASNALFGNVKSSHSKEILEFFRFLARHDNLQKRLDGAPDTLEICWPEIKSRYPEEFTTYLKQFQTGIVMQAGVSYIDAQWMDVGSDIEQMYAGFMSPQDVLNEIQSRRDKLAKLGKDPYWK